ncbi:primosomal replication protein N [Isoalcanivorax beigongshangi]|uniref:Replication restart protein PriB n=1 Tax=Isoalcanivorax beigongshangi TaxID=3238810 RepID=A0ABV4AF00_9GAMM
MTAVRNQPLSHVHNHCTLSGFVDTLEAVRMTPAGVPIRRIWIEHRSRQLESGLPREVTARLALILTGEPLTRQSESLRQGDALRATGFLARAGARGESRDRLQLHVQQLDCLD